MLFQGQEWATRTPFQFFTDHNAELGHAVTEGRRQEFKHFAAFSAPETRESIPDPQAESTFLNSCLDWSELDQEPHSSTLRLFRALAILRRSEVALQDGRVGSSQAAPLSDQSLLLRRDPESGPSILLVMHLGGALEVDLAGRPELNNLDISRCQLVLTTDDYPFAPEIRPPSVLLEGDAAPVIRFAGPASVLLRAWPISAG